MKRKTVADSHAGLLHRVRPLNALHPRQYGEQVKAAAEYAIAEDREHVRRPRGRSWVRYTRPDQRTARIIAI